MSRQWRRLLMGGLCGLLLLPQSLLAQPPLKEVSVSLPCLERLSDQALQQLSGQGVELVQLQSQQVAARIKLWDEWAKPQQPGNLAASGKNQVVMFPPQR